MHKKKYILGILTLLLFGILFILYRTNFSQEIYLEPGNSSTKDINFKLLVMYAKVPEGSYPVYIYIDDELIAEENFLNNSEYYDVNNKKGYYKDVKEAVTSIAPHKFYDLNLSTGVHEVLIKTPYKNITHKEKFEITDTHYALIGYEYNDGLTKPPIEDFYFRIQKERIFLQ